MSEFDKSVKDALEAPFDPDEVDFRPGDFGAQAIAFIDGEAVIRRLNAVFGPLGWGFEWDAMVIAPAQPRKEGGKALSHDVVWVAKGTITVPGAMPHADIGDADANETSKAAVTDALKRCATQLGVGLYLRGLPRMEARSANYTIPPDEKARLRRYLLIWQLLPAARMTEADVCQQLQVNDLAQLPEAKAKKLIERLQARINGTGETIESGSAAIPDESSVPSSVPTPSVASQVATAPPTPHSEPPADLSDKAMATDQQIFAIRGLTAKAGLTPDGLLGQLNVQSLGALTHERAAKTIDWLTAKAQKRGAA